MAPARTLLALSCLLLLITAGAAQDDGVKLAGARYAPTVYDCLTKLGLNKYKKIIDAAGLKQYFSTTYQSNTILAPTDKAVDELWGALQMTEAKALKKKQLMKKILQYNTLPYIRRYSYWPLYMNGYKKAKTLVPGMLLKLWTDQKGPKVVQGFANQAELVGRRSTYDLVCARTILHVTNEVLIPVVV